MTAITQKIDGFSLENILQIFSLERKSQSLQVKKEDKIGFLHINQGELTHATLDAMRGMEAAIEILVWDDVQIEIQPLASTEQSIASSIINVLLEVSKLKDERKSAREESGEDLLHAAIDKAEQQQYKEAHQELSLFLKKNRNSTLGWVWYSRIQGNIEVMRKALNMALSINPQDPLVRQELAKLDGALPHLKENVARKCYFCWTPLNKTTTICHHCKGSLVISQETVARAGQADATVLHEASQRYQRVLKKHPRSLAATYCLALINMNSGQFKESLVFLDKAAKMAPERTIFANQLNILLEELAKTSRRINDDQGAQAAPEAVAPTKPATAKEAEQPIILVVEDSATTRKVIAITLTRNGYRVIEAGDGLEALSKISEERPDLIMLDVILPKMDGYKILSIIKANDEFKDIPVIMLTSKDGFINKMKGKMAGSAAYLTKPFNPEMMIAEIKKHIVKEATPNFTGM